MDNIFDRAHDLVDKAQEKVASAASQAAWAANQALVVKNLEGQLAALQSEIARVTTDLGERTYQAWRAHADDPRIPALCGHLDDLKSRRAQLSADLGAARTATYNPQAALALGRKPIGAATTPPSPGATLPPPAPTPTSAPPVQAPPRPAPRPLSPVARCLRRRSGQRGPRASAPTAATLCRRAPSFAHRAGST
jgi:uncharacterized small protein (DUF1192 family)